MKTAHRLGFALLTTALIVALSTPQLAVAQRYRVSGGSNQGNADKDDNDEKDKKDNKKNDRGNGANNQSGQTSNAGKNQSSQPSGNQPSSGSANKSGSVNKQQQLQQFMQRRRDRERDREERSDENNSENKNNDQGRSNQFLRPGGQPVFPGRGPNLEVDPDQDGKDRDDAGSAARKLGRWRGDQWEGTRKVDKFTGLFGHNHQPFSAQWYKDHPQAWKYNNNKSNVWVAATVPDVYAWLGWGNVPQQYGEYRKVSRFDPLLYGDWYPLGVYSLMSGGEDMGTRIVQLAVDRHGHIAGNYYDMITNDDKGIVGEMDRGSQRVEFWLNRNPYVKFRASIFRLLQPYGSMTVRLPGGEQRWQFVRLEN